MSVVYDYIVIGSGFGGSVSALRLAEKRIQGIGVGEGKKIQDRGLPEKHLESLEVSLDAAVGFSWISAAGVFQE